MDKNSVYKPKLSIKNPSDFKKVRLLEEAVCKGTVEDVLLVMESYEPFEFTARALGIAARYRGLDFVKTLLSKNASFQYSYDQYMQGKYKLANRSYETEYSFMLIPEKIDFNDKDFYYYTPFYGIPYTKECENMQPLSLEKRIEIAKYLYENHIKGVSMEEMLFYSLIEGEVAFADALISMGIKLQKDAMEVITESGYCYYWKLYITRLSLLSEEKVLPVFERFEKLSASYGKKLIITQTLFEKIKWSYDSFKFVFEKADISKINQKKALENAVLKDDVSQLSIMAENGWLKNREKREYIIDLAQKQKAINSLAFLLAFKNKTVDLAAENEKEEKKLLRELNENPNSITALKRKWSYKKLEDGTIEITRYKGFEEEVEIPEKIGTALVSSIGEGAFCHVYCPLRINNNKEALRKIKSIKFSDNITQIGYQAFCGCQSLENIYLSKSLKNIGKYAFSYCTALKTIDLPESLEVIETSAFSYCELLEKIDFPESLREIRDCAFEGCISLKSVVLPKDLKSVDYCAFRECKLTDIYIPKKVSLHKNLFGYESWVSSIFIKIRIHIGKFSPVENLIRKNYSHMLFIYDYDV